MSDKIISEPVARRVRSWGFGANAFGLTYQVLAYAPALIIPALINLTSLGLYTHLLSATAYGRYALVLATVSIVKTVAFDWLRLGVFRFFQRAQLDHRLPVLLSTMMAGFLAVSFLVSVGWAIVLSIIPMGDGELRRMLWLGLPLLLVWALFEELLQIDRAAIAPMRYGVLSASRAILCMASALFFIVVAGKEAAGLLLGMIVGTALPVCGDLVRWGSHLRPRLVERALATDLLRYSMPFVVTCGLDFVASQSNRFLVQRFLGSGAVGVYSAGYDLANQTITMVFVVVNLAAYPLVVHALERDGKAAAQGQLHEYLLILFALALPASVGLAAVARPLASVMFGESFQQIAGALIPWVALSAFVMGAKAFYFDLAFQLGLRTDRQIWPVVAAAGLNVVLSLWWIPLFGVTGAICATGAGYTAALFLSLALGRKVFTLPLAMADFGRIALATALMAVVVSRLSGSGWSGLAIALAAGAATYGLVVWLMDVGHIRRRLAARLVRPA